MICCPVSPPRVDAPVRHRQKTVVTDMCYPAQISSLMDFGTPDCSLGKGTEPLSEICGVAVETAGGVCAQRSTLVVERERAAGLSVSVTRRSARVKSVRTIS